MNTVTKKQKAAPAVPAAPAAPPHEEAFPRGGSEGLTPLDKRRLRQDAFAEAEADLDAEGSHRKPKRRRQANHQDAGDGTDLFLSREALHGKLPKYVELLKFKNLSVGAKVWGAVQQVLAKELVVSLPHGLKGHVPAAEASDVLAELMAKAEKAGGGGSKPRPTGVPVLSDLFFVNQLVRCTVIGLQEAGSGEAGGRKRVTLSLHVSRMNGGIGSAAVQPGLVLPACVRSVEDHGYALTLGIKGMTAFLKRATQEAAHGGGARLRPGHLLEVAVTAVTPDGRLATVTTAPEAIAGAVVKEWEGLDIGSLTPGSLVNARVRNVLSDGLLVSFLTYFSGTIDCFHLAQELPPADWQSGYAPEQRLRARILHVDPTTKAVALSLQRHLLGFALHEAPPPVGTVFDAATVQRVDPGLGLLLALPTQPIPTAGFAHVSNLSDAHIDKINKAFRVGQAVKAKVLGFRPMDGISAVSLKLSVVDATSVAAGQLQPGGIVNGTVTAIEDHGIILSLSTNVRGFVPSLHTSELPSKQGKSKYRVGQAVRARVLERDAAARKLVLTLKKALVNSKLPGIAHFEDAVPGTRSHGYIAGIKEYGVFVAFYGGVRGLAHASELGLQPGQKPADCFEMAQVVKCRVLTADAVQQRLRLSLVARSEAAAGDDAAAATGAAAANGANPLAGLQPGDLVRGTVKQLQMGEAEEGADAALASVLVEVRSAPDASAVAGRLEAAHLADHPAAVAALADALFVGADLGQLLVLERMQGSQMVRLTRKASLVAAAATLPKQIKDIAETMIAPGYVASVTGDAVFVRFGGGMTGRAGLAQLADTFVSDPRRHYAEGQSVRAQVVQVDQEKKRFSLTLKPSLVSSADAGFLHSMFADLDLAERLRSQKGAEDASNVDWATAFPIGGTAAGEVAERKDYGLLCDLDDHPDIVGLVVPHQEGDTQVAAGSRIQGHILDANQAEGVVYLSLKPALQAGSAKKAKKSSKAATAGLALGQSVEALVELVQEGYVVASLLGTPAALGFAAATDYNQQSQDAPPRFAVGQTVSATVAALPDAANGGRLLLHVPLKAPAPKPKAESRKKPVAGKVVDGKVSHVHALHLDVQLGSSGRGRLHVTEWQDPPHTASASDFAASFPAASPVRAVVLGTVDTPEGRRHGIVELTTRPSALAAAAAAGQTKVMPCASLSSLAAGHTVHGFIQEVGGDHLWVALSPSLRGRVYILDASADPAHLDDFEGHFAPGQAVRCRVLQVNKARHTVDLSLRLEQDTKAGAAAFEAGALVMGRVTRVAGAGVRVQLAAKRQGKVALTDIHDTYVTNALAGLVLGRYVRCRVLSVDADSRLRLSLRGSEGGAWTGAPAAAGGEAAPARMDLADLKEGQEAQGYVKSVSVAGVFVALARGLDARVKLSNLADGFVNDPREAFPDGRLVRGRLLSTAPDRVEMTLKLAASGRGPQHLGDLQDGSTLAGRVKRIEKFGIFVELGGGALTGLAHISEVADDFVKDISQLYTVGQAVKAKVLKVDTAAGRLSLGLKPSYFKFDDGEEEGGDQPAEHIGAGNSEAESDLDEEMAANLDALQQDEDPDADDDEQVGDAHRLLQEAAETSDEDASEAGSSGEEDESEEDIDEAMQEAGSSASDEEIEDDGASSSGGSEYEGGGGGNEAMSLDLGPEDGWAGLQPAATPAAAAPQAPAEAKKLSKAQKKRLKDEREQFIRQQEQARMEGEKAPRSAEEYERLIMASPDSSYVWVKFMAHLVSAGDIDQARAVAERALQAINYRQEGEKFNVWVAWLNLENLYGSPTPEEALMALFQRALPHADQKKLYLALLAILERSQRHELADNTLKTMCRKFATSAKVWLRHIAYLLGRGDEEGARKALERSFASLPKRKHIKVIVQTALLEFRAGSAERGRSMFEGVLRNYPKRRDLWSVYLDQEIRAGEQPRIRALFERATTMQLPAKKMKFFFKRYLEYERAHGDAASVEHVKQRAREFVESQMDA